MRPGELRGAEWREFDLDTKEPEWRISGERMKMGEEHVVPLSSQAVTILRELRTLTWQFVTYILYEDKRMMTIPSHISYSSQQRLREELQRVWRPSSSF